MESNNNTNLTNTETKIFWLMALINKIASFFGVKITIEKINKTSG